MIFANMATVKITGNTAENQITFEGVTADTNLTPENAKTQIDKILNIVGKEISTDGMKRTAIQEAKDNG